MKITENQIRTIVRQAIKESFFKKRNSVVSEEQIKSMVDLHALWLQNLGGQRFKAIDMNLSRCNLSNANLSNAFFKNTNMQDSVLIGTKLNNSEIVACNFSNSDLREVKLLSAVVSQCNFEKCDFTNADATGATFISCNLTNAVFTEEFNFASKLSGIVCHDNQVRRLENCSLFSRLK